VSGSELRNEAKPNVACFLHRLSGIRFGTPPAFMMSRASLIRTGRLIACIAHFAALYVIIQPYRPLVAGDESVRPQNRLGKPPRQSHKYLPQKYTL
jgi:hypothetical protein